MLSKEIFIKRVLKGSFLVISIAIYPVIFLYLQNVEEIDFKDIRFILIVFLVIGVVIYAINLLAFRKSGFGAIVSSIVITLLYNYMIFQKVIQLIFPRLKYWHILPMMIVISAHIIFYLRRILAYDEKIDTLIMIMQFVMVGLTLINIVPATPKIIAKIKVNLEEIVENDAVLVDRGQDNVYWFIFDECASFATMEKYYDYNDKSVFNKLRELKFTISDNSRNESYTTDSVLTNCLNLDYVANSSMDAIQMSELRGESRLVKVFLENGYQVRGIGETDWMGIKNINQSISAKAKTINGQDIVDVILSNTVLSPFLQFDGSEQAKVVMDTFEWLQNVDNIEPKSSCFNVIYLCTPHQPFLFDKNGGLVSAENYANWDDEKYYMEQYIFVMDEMLKCVENIVTNDPDSIIIVQSDHGPRFNPEIPNEDKMNILNVVYFKGKEMNEIVGKSGVNTLRRVLNQHFGYNLDDAEVRDGE